MFASKDGVPIEKPKRYKFALAFGSSLGCLCFLVIGLGMFLWLRQRHRLLKNQNLFDANGSYYTLTHCDSRYIHNTLLSS